jgi:NAD(P)-dependent dehydrogenase (short-subunit alcohol dehydrogenase family)
MARVLITGSADGLGLLAARQLLDDGHDVTLHARDDRRAGDTRRAEPRAGTVLVGDLASIAEVRALAARANESGRFDAVIHNAAIGDREPRRVETVDGLEQVFAINVLAPYLLTALITPPARLVYLSSGVHVSGTANVDDPQWTSRRWSGAQAYRDSKLYDVLLAFAVARHWPGVRSNAVDPGWVPTRMGGAGAPDDLSEGAATQAWLAVSDDPGAEVTGRYLYHRRDTAPLPVAKRAGLQDALLDYCAELTGTPLPDPPLTGTPPPGR